MLGDLAAERFFKERGVYGESERVDYRPRVRAATVLEQRRLSSQRDYIFFVPYLPLALCPNVPDVVAEYCAAYRRQVEVVHWTVERQLIPSLSRRDIDTARVFGIQGPDGPAMLNFARGVVLQDEGAQSIFRLWVDSVKLIEPGVSLARPAEKILADQFVLHVFGVQSPRCRWSVAANSPPLDLSVVRNDREGDVGLWEIANLFWTRGHKTDILERL